MLMSSVRRSSTLAEAAEGSQERVPVSSRKLRRRDLTRRLSSRAWSYCVPSAAVLASPLARDGCVGGRLAMPCSSNVGSLSSSCRYHNVRTCELIVPVVRNCQGKRTV